MLNRSELRYLMALQRLPGLGAITIRKLIQQHNSAEAVFSLLRDDHNDLKASIKEALKIAEPLFLLEEADAELCFTERNGISILTCYDPGFPNLLKHCADAPLLLFSKGNIDLSRNHIVSMVGTRNMTDYGSRLCEELISGIAPLDPVIVSGFAYGVDIKAHKCAADQGLQTIACLAHGLNQYYPKIHEKYAEAIMEYGGFITEFWSTDIFDRNNFLRRNRIIAGISEATIVVESAEKGGSLVTADIANSYNRDVYAIPGKVTDRYSKGCNDLIKTQQAQMIDSAADLLYHLGWELNASNSTPQQQFVFPDLTNDESQLYQLMKDGVKHQFDLLLRQLDWNAAKLATVLFEMEFKGLLQPLPGKYYRLN